MKIITFQVNNAKKWMLFTKVLPTMRIADFFSHKSNEARVLTVTDNIFNRLSYDRKTFDR